MLNLSGNDTFFHQFIVMGYIMTPKWHFTIKFSMYRLFRLEIFTSALLIKLNKNQSNLFQNSAMGKLPNHTHKGAKLSKNNVVASFFID